MQLRSNYTWFIRIGLIGIGIAGLLFAAGDALIPQEGAMLRATEDPASFAGLVTSDGYRIWALRGLIGVPLEAIGIIALFFGLIGTSKEHWAFWGMLLCILTDVLGFGIFTLFFFVFPEVGRLIHAGNEFVASVAAVRDFMPVMGAVFIGRAIGLALLAVAIWHSGTFPRYAGILALSGWLLLLVQSYAVQIGANALWGTAFLWMAVAAWHRVAKPEPIAAAG